MTINPAPHQRCPPHIVQQSLLAEIRGTVYAPIVPLLSFIKIMQVHLKLHGPGGVAMQLPSGGQLPAEASKGVQAMVVH